MNTNFALILGLVCVVGGRASAQVNLLPQGSFEKPGVNTGWAEGFNIPNNQEFQVISENGKRWLRIENRDAGRQLDYVHAYVKVTTQIASLTVSVRMRATNLKTGKEGWHTARVALMFEGGSFGYPPVVPELRADSDWVTKSAELKVPAGATRLNIQPAMFHCTGVFEIADLVVTPHMVAGAQPPDAAPPARVTPKADKAKVQTPSSSRGPVSDVFVRTSTRNKNVSLDVELTGVKQTGRVQFVAEMLDEKGAVELTFGADDVAVEAKERQTLTLSWPWADPRLWDVGQPNLYTLRLKVKGAGLDDAYKQQFGFREFWIEGRKFFLNGTEIRLRQGCFYNGARPQVGENFWEMGNNNVNSFDADKSLNDADRKGYLAGVYILNVGRYLKNPGDKATWGQNLQRALEQAALWIRHYRNHPSAVIWIAGFNSFLNAVDQDPRYIGRRGWDANNQRWQRLLAASKDIFDGLKKIDPTRVYYSHAGACTGDVYTINCYMDLIPLQEREEWLSEWATSGEMPVSMVEFGTPMDCTFRRGRHGFTSNITSEPLLTEFSAIYFGTGAYTAEEPKYRRYLHDLFRSGMLYSSSENRLDEYANMHKIQQLYRTNTWRSWRTAGLPGGLRTWSWIQDGLKENNGPTLAWIAGPAGAYTAKDHHFRSGQKIEKQIVLINDTRQPQHFTAVWTAAIGGKEVGRGTKQGSLPVSETRFLPIQVIAPSEEAGGNADGQITLTAAIGETTHHDTFAFRVLGEDRPGKGEIALVDPGGMTSKMLAVLGYTTRAWNGAAAPLVVIGRNALKEDPAVAAKLELYVQAGGRVLICAQDPQWMVRALGWRVCPQVSRRVFPMNSPVILGIDADDLRDWTGSSTLIDAYPKYVAGTYVKGNEGDQSGPQASQTRREGVGTYVLGNEGDQPYAGWHWGNRGAVTSAAIEKPHRSGWRPLLECEFDLAYTPLMELDYGQGRLIVCTLDLEDHVVPDPAARRMAGRIMDYALHSPLFPRVSKVVYLGGATGAAWLDRIGVSYERSATLDTGAGLLLVGPDANIDAAALRAHLEQGGKALVLPRSQADGGLGVTLAPAAADFAGSLSVPDWPEARGLSASDLRWRTHLETAPWVVSAGADVGADGLIGRKVIGKGVAVFCQVDPDRFQADKKTCFRYTRWRSTRAVAQLLANLGAGFLVDSQIFRPLDGGYVGGLPESLRPKPERVGSLGYYHLDYRTDFPMGDNPYRYYRW